jgi:hypothetical protein
VPEDGLQEDHLWDEVKVDVDWALEAEGIGDLEAEREGHLEGTKGSVRKKRGGERAAYMEDSQYDGHLHLVRPGEHEPVVGAMPAGVQTEWRCRDLEKMLLYISPVYIENKPISRMI